MLESVSKQAVRWQQWFDDGAIGVSTPSPVTAETYCFERGATRSRIRTGRGSENITRLRRFAVGVIQFISDGKSSVSQKMRQLNRNTRLVFGYLRMKYYSGWKCATPSHH